MFRVHHCVQGTIAFIVGISFLWSSALAGTCETPLPDDVNIETPAANVPPEHAKFSGIWGDGKWNGKLCNTLIVEEVRDNGEVKTVYSWGTYSGWSIQKGSNRWYGKIENNKLILKGGGITVTYWFSDGQLKGTYKTRNSTSRITLSRK